MKFKEALTYDDVLLVPKYSDIISRKEVDLTSDLDQNIKLSLPIISAPMDTVTESEMAYSMAQCGALGVIHRYNTIDEMSTMVRELHDSYLREGMRDPNIAVAIGVTGKFITRATLAYENGANIVCVDVAHGHHALVKNAIKKIKSEFHEKLHVMAGNVATLEAFNDLADWGADSIRCNIGGGSICSTRIQTGHGVPGLETIFQCAKTDRAAKIIADGGLRNSGDMVKAIAAGADFVMLGSVLAGTDQSPGELIQTARGIKNKVYRGMASKEAQFDWRGEHSSDEGISTTIPYKGDVKNILQDLKNGIASGLSYSGCRNISELQSRATFVRQTSAGLGESHTHILKR
jgi:IMP dehydrogenase